MSQGRYGWLTQSTIISKKSKPITIGDSGLVDLEAALLATKNKQRQIKKQPIVPKKNAGVQERNKKDLAQNQKESLAGMVKESYNALLRKKKVYDALEKNTKNHQSFLVDFQEKIMNENKEQFMKNRQEFYEGKLDALKRQRQDLHQSVYVSQNENEARQRLAWQKKMLDELKDGERQTKQKVNQSFDKRLSKLEKEALTYVLQEKQMQKTKNEEIKAMRKNVEEDRIRKLRKLNIIAQKQKTIQAEQRQTLFIHDRQMDKFKNEELAKKIETKEEQKKKVSQLLEVKQILQQFPEQQRQMQKLNLQVVVRSAKYNISKQSQQINQKQTQH